MSLRIALLPFLCATLPAAAESPIAEVLCAPRAQLESRLSKQHRANLQATGLRGPEAVVEVWADAEGRWTLVQRWAGGLSCILAMGDGWMASAPPT